MRAGDRVNLDVGGSRGRSGRHSRSSLIDVNCCSIKQGKTIHTVIVDAGCVTVIVTALPAVAIEEVEALVVLLLVDSAVEEEVDAVLPAAVLPGAAVVLLAKELVDPTVAEVVVVDFCDEVLEVEEAARLATVAVNGGPLIPQTMFSDTGKDVA